MMEKLRAAYQRMNQRERVMTLAVAGILFALINIFIWKWVLGTIGNSGRELAARKATRAEQTVYIKERELWAKRDQWLQKTQPVLKGAEEASTLLDQLKQIAGKYNILIENPAIGSGDGWGVAVLASASRPLHDRLLEETRRGMRRLRAHVGPDESPTGA